MFTPHCLHCNKEPTLSSSGQCLCHPSVLLVQIAGHLGTSEAGSEWEQAALLPGRFPGSLELPTGAELLLCSSNLLQPAAQAVLPTDAEEGVAEGSSGSGLGQGQQAHQPKHSACSASHLEHLHLQPASAGTPVATASPTHSGTDVRCEPQTPIRPVPEPEEGRCSLGLKLRLPSTHTVHHQPALQRNRSKRERASATAHAPQDSFLASVGTVDSLGEQEAVPAGLRIRPPGVMTPVTPLAAHAAPRGYAAPS